MNRIMSHSTLSSDNYVESTDKITISSRKKRMISKHKVYSQKRGVSFTQDEMFRHRNLGKEEERALGEKVAGAQSLRRDISSLLLNMIDVDSEKEEDIEKLTDLPYIKESRALANMDAENGSAFYLNDAKVGNWMYGTLQEDDLAVLSDKDIVNHLKIKGGKSELLNILRVGYEARNELIECNLKLVSFIGRKWLRRSSKPSASTSLASVYGSGDSTTPSLDEVVQEGVLGLTRAVEKYDPDRGYRLSTYATHWITNYVRECFRCASTSCLKVPGALHDIKATHYTILRRAQDMGEPVPKDEDIAIEIGVNLKRLKTALKVTRGLLSIDSALYASANAKGSAAGGDSAGERPLLLSDTLHCPEPKPEDLLELSLLRQCLENIMATELSPHERDVIRLRLGLDDGQTKTVKEVVEVCGGSVSQAEVRSAERRAYKKLRSRHALHSPSLCDFLDHDENVFSF